MTTLEEQLYNALKDAQDHLEYCGYGDSWERQCALDQKKKEDNLDFKIEAALERARKEKGYA